MNQDNKLFKWWKILSVVSGIWTGELVGKPLFLRIPYRCYSIISLLIFSYIVPSYAVKLYQLAGPENVSEVMEIVSKMIFTLLIQIKLILNNSKEVRKLLKIASKEEFDIYSKGENEVKKIYEDHVGYCNRVVVGITIITYVAGAGLIFISAYESYHYLKKVPVELKNVTIKPLPAPMWYPYDLDKYYIFTVLLQWWSTFQTVAFNSATQALIHTVMIFIKAEFKILQYNLVNVGIEFNKGRGEMRDGEQYELKVLKLLTCKHQQLIGLVKDFNDSMKYLLLLEYSVTSLMLASTLIQIIIGTKVTFNAPFFLLLLLQLYVLGWNANEIIIQSSVELSNSLYNSNWYSQSRETKIILHTMMSRCQKPLSLSIGPFGYMDLSASISVSKLAYSLISVVI